MEKTTSGARGSSAEDGFAFYNLIHAIDSVIVLLQAAHLTAQKLNFSLHVVDADFKVVILIQKLCVLIFVPEQMSFLVLNVSAKCGTLAVPEVNLVPVLTC